MAEIKLWLLAVIAVMLMSCASEQESAVKKRIKTLDSLVKINKPALEKFFEALPDLFQLAAAQKNIASDTTQLTTDMKSVYNNMLNQYSDFYDTSGTLDAIRKNLKHDSLILVFYPDSLLLTKPEANYCIQFLKLTDYQIIFQIFDRLNGEPWTYNIAEPNDFTSEQSRNEYAALMANTITQLAAAPYIFTIKDIMLIPAKIISDSQYDSGMILVKVWVYDKIKGQILGEFYMRTKNSFLIMSMADNDKNYLSNELMQDLRNEAAHTILTIND